MQPLADVHHHMLQSARENPRTIPNVVVGAKAIITNFTVDVVHADNHDHDHLNTQQIRAHQYQQPLILLTPEFVDGQILAAYQQRHNHNCNRNTRQYQESFSIDTVHKRSSSIPH